MPGSGPQVDVFHFTSRISTAKIEKYKLATRRGMAGGSESGRASTPASGTRRKTLSPSVEPASEEPPAKKPRLKLNVRPRSESSDTIHVSRPSRDSRLRIRYDNNMNMDGSPADTSSKASQQRPSPAASSDLSSLTSTHSNEKEPSPAKESAPKSKDAEAYSRDFMSYYVTGGDDEEEEQPPPVRKKPDPPKQPQQAPAKAPAVQAPPSHGQFKHHVPQNHSNVPLPPPPRRPPPPPPMPTVHVIDDIPRSSGPRDPDTVDQMIKKLEALSAALTDFAGVPAVPKSPKNDSKDEQKPAPPAEKQPATGKKDAEVDTFLSMFDDEDSDDQDEDKDDNEGKQDDGHKLRSQAELDGPLTYGIQFIQNALKSWATQRVKKQAAEAAVVLHQQRMRNEIHPQKRGPGRPRKFDDLPDEHYPVATQPQVIRHNLSETPEGAAVAAFQKVLEAGCLRVNTVLPVGLTRALRHLYMQIDHLINQGAPKDPPWQCMSYKAQIDAHNIRIKKWEEEQAKINEEIRRQHDLAERQMMEQMGLPFYQRPGMTEEQAKQHHAIELERRRGMQQAAQQPHLTQYLTNPLKPSDRGLERFGAQSGAPTKGSSMSPPKENVPNGLTKNMPNGLPTTLNSDDPKNVQMLEKIKLYTPNYLPRSGQSMKFSFLPDNELAIKTFGAQAFPTAHTGPNLPNRGPMPPVSHPRMPNGHVHSPIPGPSGPTPSPANARRSTSETIDLTKMDDSRRKSQTPASASKSAVLNGNATPKETSNNSNPFKDVAHQRPRSESSGHGKAGTPAEKSIEDYNGMHVFSATPSSPAQPNPAANAKKVNDEAKSAELASRYPHPGAIVVDQ